MLHGVLSPALLLLWVAVIKGMHGQNIVNEHVHFLQIHKEILTVAELSV